MKDTPHLAEFRKFLDLLNKESDRGSVLIATAMLDDLLQRVITSFLLDHPDTVKLIDGFNAPLGTLSSRSLAAHAMGLISPREYSELGIMRKTRNRFAHDIRVSFDDQQMKDPVPEPYFQGRRFWQCCHVSQRPVHYSSDGLDPESD